MILAKKKQIEEEQEQDEDLNKVDAVDLSEELSNYNEIIDQLCAGDDEDDDDDDDFNDNDEDEDDDLNLSASLKNLTIKRKKIQQSHFNDSVVDLLANFSMHSKDFEMYKSLQSQGGATVNSDSNKNVNNGEGENDIDEENMFAENDIENSIQQNKASIEENTAGKIFSVKFVLF